MLVEEDPSGGRNLETALLRVRGQSPTLRRGELNAQWTSPSRCSGFHYHAYISRQVLARGQPGGGLEQCARPDVMPAKNPRVNVFLERSVYDALGQLARGRGTSLSTTARDLLRDALVMHEDLALAEIAKERERTLVRSAGLTHDEAWRGRPMKEE